VAKERLKSPRARLFVALDLPGPVRAGLVAWQGDALGDPSLRAIDHDPEDAVGLRRMKVLRTEIEAHRSGR